MLRRWGVSCGFGTSSCGPDVFYRFTPTVSGNYTLAITGNNWSGSNKWIAYVQKACTTTCVSTGAYMEGPGANTLTFPAIANQQYVIVLDGSGIANCSAGSYTLSLSAATPPCAYTISPTTIQMPKRHQVACWSLVIR